MTVLSQHTSDINSSRAFAGLKRQFRNVGGGCRTRRSTRWQRLDPIGRHCPGEGSVGIKQILTRRSRSGKATLDLSIGSIALSDAEVNEYLCSLAGVGP